MKEERVQAHHQHTIIILGGYGNFGKRIAEVLSKDRTLKIIIAGRSIHLAKELVSNLEKENPKAKITALELDWRKEDFAEKLKGSQSKILIHVAGPFQKQDYFVAKTCISLGIHYIDLSDAREFVVNITELDEAAKAKELCVISGASSVPGLSSAVVDAYVGRFGALREIDFGISPGNKVERGHATIAAILEYVGKPFYRLENNQWKTVFGWQNCHKQYYGDNVGMRWHANVDIPDLELFPRRYPTVKTVVFHAGLEISLLHWIMWKMSWLSRYNIVKNWSSYSQFITKISKWFDNLGSDLSGMYVHLSGSNLEYQPLDIYWILVAEQGEGPYIPIIPSVILVNKILNGLVPFGAQPCLGLFTLEEFNDVVAQWKIYSIVEEKIS